MRFMDELSQTSMAAQVCNGDGLGLAMSGSQVAVGESSFIMLHPPLPLVGVSIGMERERQQNDSLANGCSQVKTPRHSRFDPLPVCIAEDRVTCSGLARWSDWPFWP